MNDAFVLGAWNKSGGSDAITMLADGNGDFAAALGLEMDGSAFGMGKRGQRFSLVVNDGVAAWDDGARYGGRAVVVRSKADLGGEAGTAVMTSATTGQGLDDLRQRVLAVAGVADREGSEQTFVTTARQQALAAGARDAFAAAGTAWTAKRPPELLAVELREGAQALAQLRGVEVGDRVLDEVFARFCIGK